MGNCGSTNNTNKNKHNNNQDLQRNKTEFTGKFNNN